MSQYSRQSQRQTIDMVIIVSLLVASLTCFIAVILMRAAWHKFEHFLETVGFAQGYGIVPEAWAAPIVRSLATAEVLITAGLVLPRLHDWAAGAAAVLFSGYAGLMLVALLQGKREIDCGCGGAAQEVSFATVGRNLALCAIALAIALLPTAPVGAFGAVLAVMGGFVLMMIYIIWEKIASHRPHIRQTI